MHIAIFIVSTFGSGDAPDMSKSFASNLTKTVSLAESRDIATIKQLMNASNTHYSVFGLGSNHYPKFAAFGKYLDEAYDKLGFNRLCDFQAGDELNDQRGSFNMWLRNSFNSALRALNVDAPLEQLTTIKRYKWRMKSGQIESNLSLSSHHSVDVQRFTLSNKVHLHQEKGPPTLLLEFDGPGMKDYLPGDHLSIFPRNDQNDIDIIMSKLDKIPQPDKLIDLQVQSYRQARVRSVEDFPTSLTFNTLITYFLNINEVPSQRLLGMFSKYATDETDMNKLQILSLDAGTYDAWKHDKKNIAETLEEFPSVKMNSAYFASLMSFNKPRRYSIASSPTDDRLSLVMGVLEYLTATGRKITGLTSGMLNRSSVGSDVMAFIKYENKTPFALPANPTTPIIMIASGTGIAPFRGFWRHRCHQNKELIRTNKRSLLGAH